MSLAPQKQAFKRLSSWARELSVARCLVVSKLSRYEFERSKHRDMNDRQLEEYLRDRGSNFDSLLHYHNLHKSFETTVVKSLKAVGADVRVVNRFNFHESAVAWSDLVIPVGGDGTFLLAASKVRDPRTPVVGFNSDPSRSEGHLCLPKHYSKNVEEAMRRIRCGKFGWLMRSRIRTTLLVGRGGGSGCTHLHGGTAPPLAAQALRGAQVLPMLALNEVFMGESLSARVSHLKMSLNEHAHSTNMKCSGLCVCTGTGSTSWHLSINRLPTQSVSELLRLLDINSEDGLAKRIADVYNKNLVFEPDDARLGYTIRDLISAGVWPQPKGIQPRGFASRITVRSCCYDAGLVIDGGVSYSFNDGTTAILEIHPEDALRTVTLAD